MLLLIVNNHVYDSMEIKKSCRAWVRIGVILNSFVAVEPRLKRIGREENEEEAHSVRIPLMQIVWTVWKTINKNILANSQKIERSECTEAI